MLRPISRASFPTRSPRAALVTLLAVVATLSLACGTPTIESQIARYKTVSDKLDVLAAKQPQLKPMIDQKKSEFMSEFETLKAQQGEAAVTALAKLCARMETVEHDLNPQAATNTQPGGKLGPPNGANGPNGAPPPAPPAPNGKLGGTTAPAPTNAGGSGFGTPPPAPAPAPDAGSNSGFGTPTPTPTPNPTPTPEGGSGFGGK